MTHAPALRPMGLLEIIDQTFRLYRQNFWLFFVIAAIVFIPLGLIQSISLTGAIVGGALSLGASLFVTGALTRAVSNRYMGDPAAVGESYRYVFRRLIPFVVTMLATYVFIVGGLVLLFVGAIVFAFWAAFVTEVFIIEDKRNFRAIWRSKFLIGKGVWAEVLVLGIITGILALLIEYVAMAPLLVWQMAGVRAQPPWVISGLTTGIAQALASPIGLVASILLYYDSRIRKEGFDLEVLARELGKELPPPPPAESPPPPAQWPPAPPSTAEGGG